MKAERFNEITARYRSLRVALVGDFCLDRYLEIDAAKQETSLETGLPVHNVVTVRSQPGGAGTILNNLVALGIGEIFPVGFAGDDGEGLELTRALRSMRGVNMAHFFSTPWRRTFTYTKPLIVQAGKPPVELNRLDFKNWTPTPQMVEGRIVEAIEALAGEAGAMIVLDQVDVPDTGVVTKRVLAALQAARPKKRELPIIADSRRGLRGFPPVIFKMNGGELAALTGGAAGGGIEQIQETASALARQNGQPVFVTLAERGMVGAAADGETVHVPALAVRGEIDIVGAGDAVTANLAAALAGGGSVREALEMATGAASIVIHQLGTTGTANVEQIRPLVIA